MAGKTPSRSPTTGRRFRGQSPEQRQAQRRERLIEAGLDVFGTRGFHAVGVRDVCARARLTERYFYESFENLPALFSAVYDRGIARARKAIVNALGAPKESVAENARAALRSFLEMLRDEPRLARILLIDVFTIGEDIGKQSLVASRSFTDLMVPILETTYPRLRQEHVDAQLVANGLVGSTVYLLTQWAFHGFREPLDQMLDHCALFFEAIADALERKELAARSVSFSARTRRAAAGTKRQGRKPSRSC